MGFRPGGIAGSVEVGNRSATETLPSREGRVAIWETRLVAHISPQERNDIGAIPACHSVRDALGTEPLWTGVALKSVRARVCGSRITIMTDTQPAAGASFYHVCFAVPDLEAATTDLSRATGCRWRIPGTATSGSLVHDHLHYHRPAPYRTRLRYRRTLGHLHRCPVRSPWLLDQFDRRRIGPAVQPRIRRGVLGCPIGRPFIGHRLDSIGARIEMFDIAAQPYFLDAVSGTQAMPALDEETL